MRTRAHAKGALFRVRISEDFNPILRIQRDALHNRMIRGYDYHVLTGSLIQFVILYVVRSCGARSWRIVQIKTVFGSAGSVSDTGILTHDYRNTVGIGWSNVRGTARARVDHQHRIKIRIRCKVVNISISSETGKRVYLCGIEL